QREHRQYAALIAETSNVRERADRAQRGGRIFAADIAGNSDTGPSADARQHGHVLLAVRPRVRHGIADDSRWRLELPQHVTGLRVDTLQPAFHRAVEHHVAAGGESAAPCREILFDAPDFLSGCRIPRNELAPVPARTRM